MAVLAVLVQTDPELRRRLEPVVVSLISPPRPAEPPPSPPPPPPPPPAPPKPVPPKMSPPEPVTTVVPPVPSLPPATPDSSAITAEAPSSPAIASPAPPPPGPAPAAPPVVSAAPAPPPAPAPVVPPRFDAAYLDNPAPEYPRAARRMGEHGKVVLRVYVSPAGTAETIEVRSSSGFARLDQAAREAVQRWRFVPARQGSDPVGAWVLVPIAFLLEG